MVNATRNIEAQLIWYYKKIKTLTFVKTPLTSLSLDYTKQSSFIIEEKPSGVITATKYAAFLVQR